MGDLVNRSRPHLYLFVTFNLIRWGTLTPKINSTGLILFYLSFVFCIKYRLSSIKLSFLVITQTTYLYMDVCCSFFVIKFLLGMIYTTVLQKSTMVK